MGKEKLSYFDGFIIGILAFVIGALTMKNENKIKRLFKYTNNPKRNELTKRIDEVLDEANANGGFTAALKDRYDKLVIELNQLDKINDKK